tara:strand:+ start:81 stop:506 length:426 start_codon:yes stop_codon:yes gene_type:complete
MKEIKTIEEEILLTLKTKYKFKFENACFATGFIPKLILLDRTRNIHSYFIICTKKEDRLLSSQFKKNTDLASNLISFSKIQFSALDRPLFLIFMDQEQERLKTIEISKVKELFFQEKFSIRNLFNLAIDFDQVAPLIKQEL